MTTNQSALHQAFQTIAGNASLAAYHLRCLHPDFYGCNLDEIESWFVRQPDASVMVNDREFPYGGHLLQAATLGKLKAPFADLEDNPSSLYRLNLELQTECQPADILWRKHLAYGQGLLCVFDVPHLDDPNAELLSNWIHPHLHQEKDWQIQMVSGTPHQEAFAAFQQDPELFYKDPANLAAMKELRANPFPIMSVTEFGLPGKDASLPARVYAEIFLKEGEKRDYAFLESQGLHFNENERQAMDAFYAIANALYEEGNFAGHEAGFRLGKRVLYEKAKAESADPVLLELLKSHSQTVPLKTDFSSIYEQDGYEAGLQEGQSDVRKMLLAEARDISTETYETLKDLIDRT